MGMDRQVNTPIVAVLKLLTVFEVHVHGTCTLESSSIQVMTVCSQCAAK